MAKEKGLLIITLIMIMVIRATRTMVMIIRIT